MTQIVRDSDVAVPVGERDLSAFARRLAEQANDGEEIEVYALHRSDVDVRVYNGEVEYFTAAEVAGVGIRVIKDHRQGFAYAGFLEEEVAAEVLADARDNALYGSPDEALGLPEAEDLALSPPTLDLVSPTFGDFSTEAKVQMALDLEKAVLAADSRIRTVDSADYGDMISHVALANSRGHAVEHHRTMSVLSVGAVAEDSSGPQSGYGFDVARDPGSLMMEPVVTEAVDRSTRLLGATQPKTRRVAVVLDPLVVRSLLGVLASPLNGESVVKGRSIFADRLGEKVGSEHVHLVSDPTNPDFFGARSHDAEGVPTRPVSFVSQGVLQGFAHNVYTARRFGTRTTGSAARGGYSSVPSVGVSSFGFVPGTASLEELLRLAEGGVYVQTMHGLHSGVNPVSGDFSVGIEGFEIRDGALGAPLREATIASTLQRMLLDVPAVGSDVRILSSGPASPVLLGEVMMAGS